MAQDTEVTCETFGTMPDGEAVDVYTLTSKQVRVRIIPYGARVMSIEAPDRAGNMAEIALGHPNLQGYLADKKTYFGAIVGRYGNRIAAGTFSLNGQTYHIPTNDHGQALHGGTAGFDQKLWTAQQIAGGVEMTLASPDGDMGFPGELTVHVRYVLDGADLRIEYSATATRNTVVNLTNHTYFNLSGQSSPTILDHVLTIHADRFTPVDASMIPSGDLPPVDGTPFDFRTPHAIGERIDTPANEQLRLAIGYDHNFVLNEANGESKIAAHVVDPSSGRTLTVLTTQPGVQFYSGNHLDGSISGLNGVKYPKRGGFCLETQHFPNSPNEPQFPSTELKAAQTLRSETVFRFGTEK